jgi:YjbE family integral membrane protein
LFTVQLLQIIGLLLAGGILLLWVCWKLWRELRSGRLVHGADTQPREVAAEPLGAAAGPTVPHKTMRQAAIQIVVADVSMSLDNVLAVAGVAREHAWVLIFGLVLSVAFMGAAAAVIARLLGRFHWIAYVGLAIIFYVSLRMIYEGTIEVVAATTAATAG